MATVLGTRQHKRREQPLTVPEIVETKLGLEEGDDLLFVEEDGRIFVQREARLPLEAIVGSLKTDLPFPTDEEMDAAVERAVSDHCREKYDRILQGQE